MHARSAFFLTALVAGLVALSSACPSILSVSPCDVDNGGCLKGSVCLASSSNVVTCQCPTGSVGDGKTSCTQVASCSVIHGALVCSCLQGYSGNGTTCVKDTACSPDPCDPNAACTTAPDGGASCTCKSGFNGSGEICVPDGGTACADGTCAPHATCSIGAEMQAICTCNQGYTGDGITMCVLEANPCATNPCGSNSTCTSDGGIPECTCDDGYTSSSDGMNCTPIVVPQDAGPDAGPDAGLDAGPAGEPGDQCTQNSDCITGLCFTDEGECTVAECTVPAIGPDAGSCVVIAAGQTDAGFDDGGIASQTVCNPFTNAGCADGGVCVPDLSGLNYYCQPADPSALLPLCGDCTNGYCQGGLLCVNLDTNGDAWQCAQPCCADSDCGPSGLCSPYNGSVGFCVPN
jgi:hypothetical protein